MYCLSCRDEATNAGGTSTLVKLNERGEKGFRITRSVTVKQPSACLPVSLVRGGTHRERERESKT